MLYLLFLLSSNIIHDNLNNGHNMFRCRFVVVPISPYQQVGK